MPTTVITEDVAFIEDVVLEEPTANRFSWTAAFTGALAATGVALLLMMIGAGVGLSLISPYAAHDDNVAFLTAGAIYFLVAQAFGFAVGGHIAGRMIGPAADITHEENFHAGLHGLTVWALAVVATTSMVWISGLAAGGAAAVAANRGAATSSLEGDALSYWVDMMFRTTGAPQQHAMLTGTMYAQADTGTQDDGSTDNSATGSPMPLGADDTQTPTEPGADETAPPAAPGATTMMPSGVVPPTTTGTFTGDGMTTTATNLPLQLTTRSLVTDKAEVAHILKAGLVNGAALTSGDRYQVTRLVALDTGMEYGLAETRVMDVEKRLRGTLLRAADNARKTAEYASLWAGLALLFGAIVSVIAAMAARWEEDKITLERFRRRSEI